MGGGDRRGGEGGGGGVAWQPVSLRLLWELAIPGRGRPGAGSAGTAQLSLQAGAEGCGRGLDSSGSRGAGSPKPDAAETLLHPLLFPWVCAR